MHDRLDDRYPIRTVSSCPIIVAHHQPTWLKALGEGVVEGLCEVTVSGEERV